MVRGFVGRGNFNRRSGYIQMDSAEGISLTTRGVSLHWTTFQQIEEIAHEEKVPWNRVCKTLIELGIPVFLKFRSRAPHVAASMLAQKRYTYFKRKRTADRIITEITEKEGERVKLDDRISAALPRDIKEALRAEARRHNMKMSQILRQKMGLPY